MPLNYHIEGRSPLPNDQIKALATAIAARLKIKKTVNIGVSFVDQKSMRQLNKRYADDDYATDVLSFPLLEPTAYPARPGTRRRAAHRNIRAQQLATIRRGDAVPLGDIVVSIDRAIEQAREGRGGEDGATRHTPADELRLLVVHGALHLCGWDHRGPQAQTAMWSEQRRILRAHARAKQ